MSNPSPPWSVTSAFSSATSAAKAAAASAAKATHAAASAVAPELTASTLAAANGAVSAAHGAATTAVSHVAAGASSAASRVMGYGAGVASAELASAREHLEREAEGIKATVIATARLYTGAEPLSPALQALLAKDGFEAAPGVHGKWLKSGAVRVPWRLLPDVEGTVTVAQTRDGAGAAGVRLEVDCPLFPPYLRPSAYDAVGVFEIPIPSCAISWGPLKMGFFAYVDISEDPAAPSTFLVRVGGAFRMPLLPESLARPFPEPLPVVFRHDFSDSVAAVATVGGAVEGAVVAALGGGGGGGGQGGAGAVVAAAAREHQVAAVAAVAPVAAAPPPATPTPLLHLVALRFKPHLTDADIVRHFETEVNLKARMPELVASWSFSKNVSLEARREANLGCQWVVMANLFDKNALQAYLSHPQHVDVGRYQNPLLDGKFVVDVEGCGLSAAQMSPTC